MNRRLWWASTILLVLGVGHLTLTLVMDRARVARWLGEGLWATVPLQPGRSVDSLGTTTAFWAGWGSFSIPLVLLALLIRRLARDGVPVPAFVGWGLIGWAVIGGVMLVPSPFIVAAVPGVLVVLAARSATLATDQHPAAYGAAADHRVAPSS